MYLGLGLQLGGSTVAGEPPIITATTSPSLDDPVLETDTPADVYNAGTYESTAGTISSAVATYLVNGSSEADSYDLQEGDTLRVSVLVTDSIGNTRTFSTATRTVEAEGVVEIPATNLVGHWDGANVTTSGWEDLAGSNDFALAGSGAVLDTTPTGKPCLSLSSVGNYRVASPSGLPTGAAERTLYAVVSFDPSPGKSFAAGFGYGRGAKNEMFIIGRRDRELLINGWGNVANAGGDQWSGYAIIPGQWIVLSARLATGGAYVLYVNGVEIASGTHTFATTATDLLLGGLSGSTDNSTPMKAAKLAIYSAEHDTSTHASVVSTLTTAYITGQSTDTLAATNPLVFDAVTTDDTFYMPEWFTGGVGAMSCEVASLPTGASENRLEVEVTSALVDGTATVTYTDILANEVIVDLDISNSIPRPVANNDTFTVTEGVPAVLDVLANDEEWEEGDTLTIVSVSGATGTATIGETQTFIDYTGTGISSDSFTYVIEDQFGRQSTASVSLTVAAQSTLSINGVTGGFLDFTADDADTLQLTITEAPIPGYVGTGPLLAASSRGSGPQVAYPGFMTADPDWTPGADLTLHRSLYEHIGTLVGSNEGWTSVASSDGDTAVAGADATTPQWQGDVTDDNGTLVDDTVTGTVIDGGVDLPISPVKANGARLTLNTVAASAATEFFGVAEYYLDTAPTGNQSLFCVSVANSTEPHYLWLVTNSGGNIVFRAGSDDGGGNNYDCTATINTLGAVLGDTVQVLYGLRDDGDGSGAWIVSARKGSVGSWSAWQTANVDIPSGMNAYPFDTDPLYLFWHGSSQDFAYPLRRFALWTGQYQDPTASATRNNFFASSDGASLNGSVSWDVGAYGQPAVETAGQNATALNAKTNPGTGGNYDTITATSITDYP